MIFDLHIHTKYGSADSIIDYDDLIRSARQKGLDGICITEHGFQKTGIAAKLSRENGFIILEGIEFSTNFGDILIYGINSIPRKLIFRADELREFVAQEGGVMFVAHPFRMDVTRTIGRGLTPKVTLKDVLRRPILKLVDGLEVANGSSIPEDVAFCREVCKRSGIKGIGGSDAHTPKQIGSCVTVFENGIHCESELITELKRGGYYAEDRRHQILKRPDWWL